ncbi:MAG: succinylglutamate desuccinylase/aspartoacylase family protein [Tissierellia bacterium]|nr:succinylglutamate desuccinylase/aspartoacylase family protein [Tissierellia bacterium]MDD4725946.1 succinylglutamate desuccinylase/aspartoacylase family protein [Tissierellia bacterium]
MDNKKTASVIFLIIALVVSFIAGKSFSSMHIPEVIVAGPGVTMQKMLSDYFPQLKGTNGDAEIYILEGDKAGGSMLVLGGTHANEPGGYMAAISLIETAKIDSGTLYIIPRANNSAFSHNDAQEGSPQRFTIETEYGEREFRYGSRATNPIDQWPDPDVYVHAASGQQLSGSETRNLNRAYPGRSDGTFTEKVTYAITEMIKVENIDITLDLHEASPEYPVINAIVSHEYAMGIASVVTINLQLKGVDIALEPSPTNLRGLTHRELGDYTDTLALLAETANAAQGRLRGKTDEDLVIKGKDKMYVNAAKRGNLYVPFDENGHPLEERVGRHLETIKEITSVYTAKNENNPIIITNLPDYEEIQEKGVGFMLNPLS